MPALAVNGGKPVRTRPWPVWPQVGEREVKLVSRVVRSGRWSFDGPLEERFSKAFAAYLGASHVLCVANGSVSLEIALKALGVVPGDEVIVPPTTWYATATAVVNIGAVPVFADIDPQTYCLSPAAAERAVTERTAAIIPVHLYGCMADMDAILRLARKRRLKVIEDCAHTHGSRWRGRAAGTLGDIGSFSFQQSKVLTAGEGGAVVTGSEGLAARLYALKNCGRRRSERDEQVWGHNYRITEMQAALLLAQLSRLPAQHRRREGNARYLDEALPGIPGVAAMKRHPQVTTQAYYIYAFRYDAASFDGAPLDRFIAALRAEGIPAGRINEPVYRGPLFPASHPTCLGAHEIAGRRTRYHRVRLPVAERAYAEEGVFFHHALLLGSRSDTRDIVDAVRKIHTHRAELAGRAGR